MATVEALRVAITGDAGRLLAAVKSSQTQILALAKIARNVGLGAAAAGGAAAIGLAKIGASAKANVDAIANQARELDTSVELAQRIGVIAKLSGTEVDDIAGAFKDVGAAIRAAIADPAGEAAQKFAELGVSVDTLKRAGTVIDGLGLSLAGAASDVTTINTGLGSFEVTAVQASQRVSADFQELLTIMGTLRDLVFAEVVPAFAELTGNLVGSARESIALAGGGRAIAKAFGEDLVGALNSATEGFSGFVQFLKNVRSILEFITRPLRTVWQLIGGLGAIVGALGRGEFSGAARIAADLPGDLAGTLTGDNDDEQLSELEEQTRLLRQISDDRAIATFG